MSTRGRLIVFEGGEATGKSTQSRLLADHLRALATREPGGTPAGDHIRSLILDPGLPPLHPRTETLLLLASRAQHVAEVIEPALAAGRTVVCDRFAGSTLAYQGWGRGLALGELETMSAWASSGVEPDVVLLLQVPAGVAARRLGSRGGRDRLEGEGSGFFERVRAGFAELAAADPGRWRVVDGDGPVEAIFERVLAALG